MDILTLATIFAAGFVIMTPVGPVSTICIRRFLIDGPHAGMVAGAGDAVAVAAYATIGVSGCTLVPRYFAPFATMWHIAIAVVLVVVAIVIWRSGPALPTFAAPTRASLASGFGAALAVALANPADIVVFAALFTGLGIAVHTPLQQVLFCCTIFAGGCAYWAALVFFFDRWRDRLTTAPIAWLNRTSCALMLVAAVASLVSVARPALVAHHHAGARSNVESLARSGGNARRPATHGVM